MALLLPFIAVEPRSRQPMLDLALFRRTDFVAATAAGAGLLALSNVVPTVLERGLGYSSIAAVTALAGYT